MEAKQDEFVIDDYEVAETSANQTRGKTGVVFDDYNIQHRCEWDPQHPECPERYLSVINRYDFVRILLLFDNNGLEVESRDKKNKFCRWY